MLEFFICIIYLWYSYSIFMTKTFGSFVFMGLILITCISLGLSVILYLINLNKFYLFIPFIPHCLCVYWDRRIRKRLNFKKID